MLSSEELVSQIDRALKMYDEQRAKGQHDDLSDLNRLLAMEVKTIVSATLDRIAPPGSPYRQPLESPILYRMVGALRAMRRDLLDGTLSASACDQRTRSKKRIFISHGSQSLALNKIDRFVRALGLEPIIVKDGPSLGGSVDDVVETALESCSALISLATKDVEVEGSWRARQNVIHEIGMAQQKLRDRVIYLKEKDCVYPSNVQPKIWEDFTQDNMEDAFIKVAKELHAFGIL